MATSLFSNVEFICHTGSFLTYFSVGTTAWVVIDVVGAIVVVKLRCRQPSIVIGEGDVTTTLLM